MTQQAADLPEVVYAVVAAPGFAGHGICFAARPAGVFRSDDGGRTWRDLYTTLPFERPVTTAALAVSPDFEHDRCLFAGVPGGVLRSSDGGQTWHAAGLGTPPPFVSALAVSPNFATDGTLFAGTLEDGVFRSADGGRHWAAWNFGLLDLNVLCMAISPDFARDETLFVGVESGLYRSTTGGRAWREPTGGGSGPQPADFAPVLSLAISPHYATDGTLWAGSEGHGLFCSRDRGKSWTPLGEGCINGAVNSILVAADYPARPHLLVSLGDRLLVSRDDGISWQAWPLGVNPEGGITALAAPLGLEPGAPLLLGLAGGRMLRLG